MIQGANQRGNHVIKNDWIMTGGESMGESKGESKTSAAPVDDLLSHIFGNLGDLRCMKMEQV